ncbi:hypothetical protein HN859_05465 [Candidatus Parcubacteria bacterium]|mgnify:CR=1 FL=1|jgi:hypothetical protein|nr:hypothetical protein [Candidatus Parcubacteria bacterium]
MNKDLMFLNGSLTIMKRMYQGLCRLPVDDAIRHVSELDDETKLLYARKDGKDTLWFDIVAEDIICLGGTSGYGHYSLFQRIYHQSGVVITEERGRVPKDRRIEPNTPIIISDPIDGSSHLKRMIKDFGKDCKTMGEVFAAERKSVGTYLSRVHAPNASVTFLKDNQIKFTIVVNFLTGEVYVAYEKGVFVANIKTLRDEASLSKRVIFRNDDESESMLCYNAEGRYNNNLQGTHLRFFPLDTSIEKPLGPLRFAYLLDIDKDNKPISVVAHNGEKIQEALPNIAIAFFSYGELMAFKLFCDREYHEARAGKLLTPVLQNSLYRQGLMVNTGLRLIFLNNHEYPSQFRDTTVIISAHNEPALAKMLGMVEQGFAMRIV